MGLRHCVNQRSHHKPSQTTLKRTRSRLQAYKHLTKPLKVEEQRQIWPHAYKRLTKLLKAKKTTPNLTTCLQVVTKPLKVEKTKSNLTMCLQALN